MQWFKKGSLLTIIFFLFLASIDIPKANASFPSTQLGGGYFHTVTLKKDGTVWTFGYNASGALGDGTNTHRNTPVQVPNLTGITQVSTGTSHTLAVKSDGTVWSFGNNQYGQLGDGTTTNRTLPVQAVGITGVAHIAAGLGHTLSLKDDGTFWAWGYNSYGQLGNGTNTDSHVPVQTLFTPSTPTDTVGSIPTRVSAGQYYTEFIKSDGTVWAVGEDSSYQLGDGETARKNIFIQVPDLLGITQVSAGIAHAEFVKSDGTVLGVGYNYYNQLGDGTGVNRSTPVKLPNLTGITQVSAGSDHTAFLKNDGTAWTVGTNSYGQLGDGTVTAKSTPVQVSSLTGIVQVSAGNGFTEFLKNDGTVWASGRNAEGQLGDGTTSNKYTPVQIKGLTGIVQIATGTSHTVFLKNDGTVWAVGWNGHGEYGNGTTVSSSSPVQVPNLTGIVQVSAGNNYTEFLKSDGTVWSAGSNSKGQLGDDTITNRNTPVQVKGLTGIVQVAAGDDHAVFLKNDETVWTVGGNFSGQLGNGTNTDSHVPVQALFTSSTPTDTTGPDLSITNETPSWTNSNVTLSANATDDSSVNRIQTPDDVWHDGDTVTYTVSSNGTYQFIAEDDSGNQTTKTIVVSNIDKTPPILTITGNPTSTVHKKVTLTATGLDSESGVNQVQTPDGVWHSGSSVNYKVGSNGTYQFVVEDNAGNQYTQTVNVTNIGDLLWISSLPESTLNYNDTLNGTSQSLNTAGTKLSVEDNRETGQGWHVNVQSTSVRDSFGHVLPWGTLQMKAPVITGTDTSVTSPISGYQSIDGSSPVSIASAALNKGMGSYTIDMSSAGSMRLNVPARTYKGSYSSTITWQLVSAP